MSSSLSPEIAVGGAGLSLSGRERSGTPHSSGALPKVSHSSSHQECLRPAVR